jgi:hypothetical protein
MRLYKVSARGQVKVKFVGRPIPDVFGLGKTWAGQQVEVERNGPRVTILDANHDPIARFFLRNGPGHDRMYWHSASPPVPS